MSQKPPISRSKALVYWIVTILLFFIIIWIPGEIITRLNADNTPYYKKAALDEHLGWRTKPHYSAKSTVQVKKGKPYPVTYETGEHGFRPYGNLSSTRKKLLVVGDSYTQAVEANNGNTYADHLAHGTDTELFCYGQAGYGTTQQYLFIQEHIDEINPDLLVLQVCGNDFIDNYAPLELVSNYKVGEKRPYMDLDGNITHHRPIPTWQRYNDKSEFLKLLRKKVQTTMSKKVVSAQKHINDKGQDYQPYKKSIGITSLGLKKIKAIADKKNVPMVVIIAGYIQPYVKDMKAICDQQNIICLTQPAKELRKQENQLKQPVRCADKYHWTELGHKVIAENMLDTISTLLHPPIAIGTTLDQ